MGNCKLGCTFGLSGTPKDQGPKGITAKSGYVLMNSLDEASLKEDKTDKFSLKKVDSKSRLTLGM